MQYIDSYMDVRARQIYDKLKSLLVSTNNGGSSSSDGSIIKDAIYIKDAATEKIYKVYIEDGNICHEEVSIEDVPTEGGGEGDGGGCHCCDHDIIINNYIEGTGDG